MLTALGATEAEDRVYQHVASALSATEDEIVRFTGLAPSRVRDALSGLEKRALATRTTDTPPRFVAAAPGAVESMITDRLRELRTAQEELDQIAERYRSNYLVENAPGAFEVVRGQEALRQWTVHMLTSARFEALNLVKPPIITIQSDEGMRPGDNVRGRLIFETEALGTAGALEAIQRGLRDQDEVRVHTKLPIKMLAVDRSVALVPLAQRDTTPVGVVIRESAVLDSFLALFDYVWTAAVPLHVDNENSPPPAMPTALSPNDRRLLSLLLSGLTDEAIAAHWGVSVRTVQRKVHALMKSANVRTRMQLAWQAARLGWV